MKHDVLTKVFILLSVFGGLLLSSALAQPPAKRRTVQFSGYRWTVKQGEQPMGPGPGYFSGREEDVFVDKEGRLHLRIAQHDGRWYSTEVICEKSLGYGTYVFYLATRMDNLNPNAVLGLYTWDDNTFPTDANSEIDIEFSKWADPGQKILQFTVQPTQGPDVPEGGRYHERYTEFDWPSNNPKSAHFFTWTEKSVRFESFEGHDLNRKPIEHWEYENQTQARRARDGANVSGPVLIPRPFRTTQARINLWQVDADNNGLGDPPAGGKDVEVVIEKFQFMPARK